MNYSLEQSVSIFEYYLKTGSFKDCKNAFMEKLINNKVSTKSTIHQTVQQFHVIWSVIPPKQNYPKRTSQSTHFYLLASQTVQNNQQALQHTCSTHGIHCYVIFSEFTSHIYETIPHGS
jgi:hypothetical protein